MSSTESRHKCCQQFTWCMVAVLLTKRPINILFNMLTRSQRQQAIILLKLRNIKFHMTDAINLVPVPAFRPRIPRGPIQVSLHRGSSRPKRGVSSFCCYLPLRLPAWSSTLHIRAVQPEIVCATPGCVLRCCLHHTVEFPVSPLAQQRLYVAVSYALKQVN